MRMIVVACLLVVVGLSHARGDTPRVFVVGTHDDPPFTTKLPNGEWSGISIELLRTVAADMGATIKIKEIPRAEMTTGPNPDVDVVATLNVSEKMNARYDLSHAFYSTGLSIAIPEAKKESAWGVIVRIFSGTFLLILLGVLALLATVGYLMWRIEKRPVKPMPTEKAALSKALFWAFEPVIGYKSSQHATRSGRVLGTVWGLAGVVLVSSLTANLSSQLTARQLAYTVRGPDDLMRVKVAVVDHTAGKKYCDRRGIRRTVYDNLDAAFDALDRKEVEAVIEDAPNLLYAAQNTRPQVRVLPGTFANHGYAFGLRPESPIRRELNVALLKVTSGDAFRSLLVSYLGPSD